MRYDAVENVELTNNDLDQSAETSHNMKSSLGALMSSSPTLGNFYCECAGFSSRTSRHQ